MVANNVSKKSRTKIGLTCAREVEAGMNKNENKRQKASSDN